MRIMDTEKTGQEQGDGIRNKMLSKNSAHEMAADDKKHRVRRFGEEYKVIEILPKS